MKDKITNILGSVRFWIVTLTAVIAILESYVAMNGFAIGEILDIVKVWLGVVAGIGTLDSVATKFGTASASVKKKK